DVAAGIHRPLTLTALALHGDSGPIVLITADLGWWRQVEDEAAVRSGVLEAHGLEPDRLMLHLTHTHAGPSICSADADLDGGELVPEYLARLREAAIEATGIALSSAVPATLTVATGQCGVAANRDLPCGERYVVGFNPDVPADDTVLAGRVADVDGRVIATLVNYACHPTTFAWENALISPDFAGALREVVEAGTGGAPCLFLQGASGELAPREQYTADPEVVDRHGRAIGHAALSAVEALPAAGRQLVFEQVVESGAPLAWWRPRDADWPHVARSVTAGVPVPARSLPALEELERQWAGIDPASRATRLERAEKLRATYPADGQLTHPVWVWRLGDIILVGHPGEAFSLLQTELRRRFADNPVFVLNLVNGPGWVYLPPRESYVHDKYQVWQTTLGEGSLEILIDAVTDRIADLMA
ncbi:MAG TPA: hypothetical protein VHC49_04765, partial [Mycobacteriales bacterium]|nr:hypothetical protein [Mycobacteriales bacterium]